MEVDEKDNAPGGNTGANQKMSPGTFRFRQGTRSPGCL